MMPEDFVLAQIKTTTMSIVAQIVKPDKILDVKLLDISNNMVKFAYITWFYGRELNIDQAIRRGWANHEADLVRIRELVLKRRPDWNA